ncbi:MAG: hypothetical protein U0521_29040 [Anaerolineae bacterium]
MAVTLPSGHKRIDHAEMRGITIRFPGVLANDRVDFDAKAGEIHATGRKRRGQIDADENPVRDV